MEKESNEALSKQKFANKSLYATQQPPCSQKQCCHNCKFLIELFKHPFNKIYNGAISESTALFACIEPNATESGKDGVIFEDKHGMCEMWESAANS